MASRGEQTEEYRRRSRPEEPGRLRSLWPRCRSQSPRFSPKAEGSRKERSAAKPQPKWDEPRIARMTRINTSQHGFHLNPCNPCNPRSRVLAKKKDSDGQHCKRRKEGELVRRLRDRTVSAPRLRGRSSLYCNTSESSCAAKIALTAPECARPRALQHRVVRRRGRNRARRTVQTLLRPRTGALRLGCGWAALGSLRLFNFGVRIQRNRGARRQLPSPTTR